MESARPELSIIMPVYNAMPYLTRALDSLLAQTCGQDRMEIIAIDDGSTDESGDVLDRYAAEHPSIRVYHQENSGLPSKPRNRGIELARGEYVFFCDNDDYMGEEACERLLRHAREWDSDVVLAKLVGVGGRYAPRSMFDKTQPDADLYTSRVTWTLGPWKLFRRSLLIANQIRFPEDALLEDIVLVLKAYFRAEVISVAADYDYYFYTWREDGLNITTTDRWNQIERRFRGVQLALETIIAESDPARRDGVLMVRIFRDEISEVLRILPVLPDTERAEWFTRIRDIAAALYSPVIGTALPLDARVLIEAMILDDMDLALEVADPEADFASMISAVDTAIGMRITFTAPSGKEIVLAPDDVAARAIFPLPRITAMRWNGRFLELEGTMTSPVAGVPTAACRMKQFENERVSHASHVEVSPHPQVLVDTEGHVSHVYEWATSVDTAQLLAMRDQVDTTSGKRTRWDLYLSIAAHGTERDVRIGSERSDEAARGFFAGCALLGDTMFVPYQTGYHNVSLQEATDWQKWLAPRDLAFEWTDSSKGRLRVSASTPSSDLTALRYRVVVRRRDKAGKAKGVAGLGVPGHMCTVPLKREGAALVGTLALGMVNGAEPLADGEWEVLVVTDSFGGLVRMETSKARIPDEPMARFRRRLHLYRATLADSNPVIITSRRVI